MNVEVTGIVFGFALEPLVRKKRRIGSATRTPPSPPAMRSISAEMSAYWTIGTAR